MSSVTSFPDSLGPEGLGQPLNLYCNTHSDSPATEDPRRSITLIRPSIALAEKSRMNFRPGGVWTQFVDDPHSDDVGFEPGFP